MTGWSNGAKWASGTVVKWDMDQMGQSDQLGQSNQIWQSGQMRQWPSGTEWSNEAKKSYWTVFKCKTVAK